MGKRKLSESEVYANYRNRHEQNILKDKLENLCENESNSLDLFRVEMTKWRQFRKENLRNSGRSPKALQPSCKETSTRSSRSAVQRNVATRPGSELPERQWAYTYKENSYNQIYKDNKFNFQSSAKSKSCLDFRQQSGKTSSLSKISASSSTGSSGAEGHGISKYDDKILVRRKKIFEKSLTLMNDVCFCPPNTPTASFTSMPNTLNEPISFTTQQQNSVQNDWQEKCVQREKSTCMRMIKAEIEDSTRPLVKKKPTTYESDSQSRGKIRDRAIHKEEIRCLKCGGLLTYNKEKYSNCLFDINSVPVGKRALVGFEKSPENVQEDNVCSCDNRLKQNGKYLRKPKTHEMGPAINGNEDLSQWFEQDFFQRSSRIKSKQEECNKNQSTLVNHQSRQTKHTSVDTTGKSTSKLKGNTQRLCEGEEDLSIVYSPPRSKTKDMNIHDDSDPEDMNSSLVSRSEHVTNTLEKSCEEVENSQSRRGDIFGKQTCSINKIHSDSIVSDKATMRKSQTKITDGSMIHGDLEAVFDPQPNLCKSVNSHHNDESQHLDNYDCVPLQSDRSSEEINQGIYPHLVNIGFELECSISAKSIEEEKSSQEKKILSRHRSKSPSITNLSLKRTAKTTKKKRQEMRGISQITPFLGDSVTRHSISAHSCNEDHDDTVPKPDTEYSKRITSINLDVRIPTAERFNNAKRASNELISPTLTEIQTLEEHQQTNCQFSHAKRYLNLRKQIAVNKNHPSDSKAKERKEDETAIDNSQHVKNSGAENIVKDNVNGIHPKHTNDEVPNTNKNRLAKLTISGNSNTTNRAKSASYIEYMNGNAVYHKGVMISNYISPEQRYKTISKGFNLNSSRRPKSAFISPGCIERVHFSKAARQQALAKLIESNNISPEISLQKALTESLQTRIKEFCVTLDSYRSSS